MSNINIDNSTAESNKPQKFSETKVGKWFARKRDGLPVLRDSSGICSKHPTAMRLFSWLAYRFHDKDVTIIQTSYAEIARALGCDRKRLPGMLSQLHGQGWIRWSAKRSVIKLKETKEHEATTKATNKHVADSLNLMPTDQLRAQIEKEKQQSTYVPTRLHKALGNDAVKSLVLSQIMWWASRPNLIEIDGECYFARGRILIARRLGLTEDRVRAALKWLKENDLIEVKYQHYKAVGVTAHIRRKAITSLRFSGK